MESSTVLAFRIFVMLSCLVIVPLAAIFGSAFPDVVKTVLVDRIVEWTSGKPPASNNDTSTGPLAGDAQRRRAGATDGRDAPKWGSNQATAAAPWQGQERQAQEQRLTGGVVPVGAANAQPGDSSSASYAGGPASFAGGTASFAGGPASFAGGPTSTAGGPDAMRSPASVYGQDRAADMSRGWLPEATPQARPGAVHPLGSEGAVRGAPSGALEQPDRFTTIERRLRELGASYYLLETWGQQGELYRFHCKMATGNNSTYTRHFESTDRDALRAMAQVLDQVESWRAGRTQ